MAKIDVYLRSMERFGAAGAILASGQSVTLRFPTGDRHATQVTPHDQLVALIREVAPPAVLDQIDKNRPAKFDIDSNGLRYALTVSPKPGAWQLAIELAAPAAAPPVAAAPPPTPKPQRAATSAPAAAGDELAIERGQYAEQGAPPTTSGSLLLDQLTAAARSARATDVYLQAGAPPAMRVGDDLQPVGDRGALDAETISRELGGVAPAAARAAWSENGLAVFTYGDGIGRVRAALTRDHRGPGAALRLLVGEAPALDRLGIAREVAPWLDGRGLVLVAGPSGIGKTTTLAALVRALGDKRRRVVTIEDPIEIVHVTSPWVSQRAIGEHVPNVTAAVAAAMREAADAIVVGAIGSPEAAGAVVEAVAAGHLVLATIACPSGRGAVDHLVDLLPPERRELARGVLADSLLGTIAPIAKAGGRSFEVTAGRGG